MADDRELAEATAPLSFAEFLDRMKDPAAADLVRSIKKWVLLHSVVVYLRHPKSYHNKIKPRMCEQKRKPRWVKHMPLIFSSEEIETLLCVQLHKDF